MTVGLTHRDFGKVKPAPSESGGCGTQEQIGSKRLNLSEEPNGYGDDCG
jgi:hypothetical protein